MKITFEFDTCDENFDMEELARFNKALDMAKALYEILDECGINFDELYK